MVFSRGFSLLAMFDLPRYIRFKSANLFNEWKKSRNWLQIATFSTKSEKKHGIQIHNLMVFDGYSDSLVAEIMELFGKLCPVWFAQIPPFPWYSLGKSSFQVESTFLTVIW